MTSFSALVPAYNAADTLPIVLKELLNTKNINLIIVVDDGSTDSTASLVSKFKKRNKKIILLQHKENKGYGASQKTGMNYFLSNCKQYAGIILFHADNQYPIDYVPTLIQSIKKGFDIVGGSRILHKEIQKSNMPFHKRYGNKFLSFIQNIIFQKKYHIYHSGFKGYSLKALKTIHFNKLSDKYEFDTEMIIGGFTNNLTIQEFPIPCRYENEVSYLRSIPYGLRIVHVLIKYIFGKYN